MRSFPLGLLLLLTGAGDARSAPAEPPKPRPVVRKEVPRQVAPAAGLRCLPVVAAPCHCVFPCGIGTLQPDGTYQIHHERWKDGEVTGRIDRWCFNKECTDALFADIYCDAVCAPKPADKTCHFVGTSCVSGRKAP